MVIELTFQRSSTKYACIGYKEMAVFSGSVRSKGIAVQWPMITSLPQSPSPSWVSRPLHLSISGISSVSPTSSDVIFNMYVRYQNSCDHK